MTTVLWDVDTRDWTNPGSEAIYSTAVNKAKPGSIILLHDGGGYRGQTVSALPRIISTLRSRGYRFVTVSRLLGGRPRYVTVR
jgi:peptidoglycan/xylan/chitin deacetylase (PgdA/CDA1 family)